MAVQPIIVNNTHTRYVDCIVQAGKKYCEKSEFEGTPKQLGVGLLVFTIILFVWGYVCKKAIESDSYFLPFIAFSAPLWVPALLLLIFS